MPTPRLRRALLPIVVTTGLALASIARGQADATLLWADWQPGEYWAQTLDRIVFIPAATTSDDEDIDALFWDSSGHVRIARDDPTPPLTFGYRLLTLGVHGDDGIAAFPDDLNDAALVASYRFGDVAADGDELEAIGEWRVAILGGAGTANDGHWNNSDALYGIAAIDFQRRLDADRTLHLGVEYHGNRVFLNDIPLPLVRFEERVNQDFSYAIGFPQCAAMWTPLEQLTLEVDWMLGSDLRAAASWDLSPAWSIFAEFEHSANAFHLEASDDGDDRLFHELSRFMVGGRWRGSFIDAQFGVGYAFNQDFTFGDDVWDADGVTSVSDELVFMLNLRGTF